MIDQFIPRHERYFVAYIDHSNKFTIVMQTLDLDEAIEKCKQRKGSKVFKEMYTHNRLKSEKSNEQ